MENNLIKLTLGDWIWNAAILGFINIVGEENVEYRGATAEIPIDCLENFEEKYFRYFINTYKKVIPWYKIVNYKDRIEYYRENNYDSLSLKDLKLINEFIKDTAKRYLSSNSFKAAFELMGSKERMEKLEKSLQKIKEPKDENAFERERCNIIKEIEKQFKILEEIIEYCGSENSKRYIGAKNVIYSIIKNGWNGVCFLNPQTKIKDIYEDYRMYFVETAREYLQTKNKKNKYCCYTCGEPIKDLDADMSFLNQSGFDTARKPSHVWNFVNDIALCPVCKLVYSCLPAGFVYVGGSGLYVNANINMKYNFKVNTKLKADILSKGEEEYSSRRIYAVLVNALREQQIEKSRYELADVQIVRYEKETYKFNLLPEMTIKLIDDFSNEITGLLRTGYREGNENISLYEQVLNYIFNNQNLFLLINKLLHYKLSSPNDCYFGIRHILNMLKINAQLIRNLGGIGNMDKNRDYLKEARGAGFYLRDAYLKKDPNTGKIPGISYRLLNALKTGNRNMFMDLVLNCYMYVGREVPSIITEVLREDDAIFATIGYAFVACFIEGEKDTRNDSENGNKRITNGEELRV